MEKKPCHLEDISLSLSLRARVCVYAHFVQHNKKASIPARFLLSSLSTSHLPSTFPSLLSLFLSDFFSSTFARASCVCIAFLVLSSRFFFSTRMVHHYSSAGSAVPATTHAMSAADERTALLNSQPVSVSAKSRWTGALERSINKRDSSQQRDLL